MNVLLTRHGHTDVGDAFYGQSYRRCFKTSTTYSSPLTTFTTHAFQRRFVLGFCHHKAPTTATRPDFLESTTFLCHTCLFLFPPCPLCSPSPSSLRTPPGCSRPKDRTGRLTLRVRIAPWSLQSHLATTKSTRHNHKDSPHSSRTPTRRTRSLWHPSQRRTGCRCLRHSPTRHGGQRRPSPSPFRARRPCRSHTKDAPPLDLRQRRRAPDGSRFPSHFPRIKSSRGSTFRSAAARESRSRTGRGCRRSGGPT